MLSIIVPVRNESNIIHEVFDYFSNNLKDIKYEVLIINDYSNDEAFEWHYRLQLNQSSQNVLNSNDQVRAKQLLQQV